MSSGKIRKVNWNIVWLAGDRVLRMIVGLVVIGMVADYLEPVRYGSLEWAVTMRDLFLAVAMLGIDGIVIRELVRHPERKHGILGTAFVLRLIGGCIALLLVYLSSLLTGKSTSVLTPLNLIVALAFFPQAFDVIDLWFQKNIQSKYTVVAKTVALLIGSGIKITFVIQGRPLYWFGWALMFDFVLNAMALMVVYRNRDEQILLWRPSFQIGTRILKDSWPLIFSGLLIALYQTIERIFVMDFLGGYQLGIYSTSVRVTQMWMFIPGTILASIYPILVEQKRRNESEYRRQLQLVFDFLTALGFITALGVSLGAPLIISLVFGEVYADASTILMIQAWSAPITFSGSVRAQYFLLENFTIYHTISAVLGMAFNVTAAVLLMPEYGAVGAALGGLIGYWVAGYLSSLIFRDLRDCALIQTKAFLFPFRLRWIYRELRRFK
ncbi:MAG TPA: flippase [Verrucomicrobia bacterium]|nr:flippase [Verrucomicrobiota bacterium]